MVLVGCWASGSGIAPVEGAVFSTAPSARDGGRWRIAYYQGGAHANYYHNLRATVRGLMELGWIESAPLPQPSLKDPRVLWDWLVGEARSRYLEFVPGAFYSADWDGELRSALRREVLVRLNETGDIDLMIAMGTWAGIDLANDEHATPTIVMSTSDPVRAGIIASVQDSGHDHVHARVDPRRYERQLRLFHDSIGFSRLGVAYEDTVYGRSYAAIDMVEKMADERGFEVRRCHTLSDVTDQARAEESVIRCFEELAPEVDALYVTIQGGVNTTTIPELVRIANRHRVPTFSQLGSEEVRYGFLMSLSRSGFDRVGRFLARTIAKTLNGARPRSLEQLYEEAGHIAVNLKTAELIGLYLYADLLAAADEIYHSIEVPR